MMLMVEPWPVFLHNRAGSQHTSSRCTAAKVHTAANLIPADAAIAEDERIRRAALEREAGAYVIRIAKVPQAGPPTEAYNSIVKKRTSWMCDMQQPGCSVLPETSGRLITLRQVAYTGEEHPRGLFASAPIARGTLVEASPCILIPPDQYHTHLRHTVLEHYLFRGREGRMLMCLGLGSMFNHSSRPNVDYRVDVDRLVISFTTARDVQQGEELFIFYGSKLWFEDRGRDPTGAAPAETPLHEHMDDEATFLRALQL